MEEITRELLEKLTKSNIMTLVTLTIGLGGLAVAVYTLSQRNKIHKDNLREARNNELRIKLEDYYLKLCASQRCVLHFYACAQDTLELGAYPDNDSYEALTSCHDAFAHCEMLVYLYFSRLQSKGEALSDAQSNLVAYIQKHFGNVDVLYDLRETDQWKAYTFALAACKQDAIDYVSHLS